MVRRPLARARLAVLTLPCLALIVACGATARPAPPVSLTVYGPGDGATTLAGEVSVSGTVTPATASVLVGGQAARVQRGSFSVNVPVRPGTNVIDVLAGAPRAQGAMSAVRVYRQLPVAVPDLGGASPSAAAARLARFGLKPQVHDVGGFWQALIPASSHVCQTVPPRGRLLAPGTAIEVQTAKIC